MFAMRIVAAWMVLYAAVPAHADAPVDPFAHDLATARDEAVLMPRAALKKFDRLQDERRGADLGQVFVETSLAYARLGDKDKALDAAAQAEKLGRDLHDDPLLTQALLAHAGAVSSLDHDVDAARALVQQADKTAEPVHDAGLEAQVLTTRAVLAEAEGRDGDGLQLATDALAAARLGEDPHVLAMALRVRARLLAADGQYREALACTDELRGIAQASKQPAQMAQARLAEYAIAAQAGNVKRAETSLQAAIDVLQRLGAKEALVLPLANMAELYTQQKSYGEAARASETALRLAREVGDRRGAQIASYQSGIADIHFRNIAAGRRIVEAALDALREDDHYLPMLLEYGHALGTVGESDGALTVYRKAGAVSRAGWRKGRQLTSQLSYLALQRAYDNERKKSELAALRHDATLKAAELENERHLRRVWALLSIVAAAAVLAIALLYRRVASTNRLLHVKNAQLFHQSTRDSLTGLFNRHYFYEHVVPTRLAQPGGVFLLMDVDRFKSINDTYGHSAGDIVLKSVAERLTATLREQDVLVRWGGEEFLAFLPGVGTAEARRVCARILAGVSTMPIAIEGKELVVTISMGFCPHPATAGEAGWEQLVHLADLCLYLAKTAGRNQAFGISDASALTPDAIAAADADMRQASDEGLVALLNVKS